MTVQSIEPQEIYDGDAVTRVFPYGFDMAAESSLRVSFVSLALVETVVPPEDYTVTRFVQGGEVTFDLAPPADVKVVLTRQTPLTQQVSVTAQTAYDPRVVESVWDKLTVITQELALAHQTMIHGASGTDPTIIYNTLMQAAETAGEYAGQAEAAAAQAALYDGPWLGTIGELLADTTLTYGTGASGVTAGDIVRTRAEGFAYRVIADSDPDYDFATAGGVRLYLLPSDAGHYNFAGMAPAADGVTDDFPKLQRLLDRPGVGTGYYQTSPPIYFPNGSYFMGQTIQLKRSTRLFGNASGQPSDSTARLVFPANTGGIIVHRYNTIGNEIESPATTAADATLIEGISLVGGLGSNTEAHGIWLRARAIVRNIRIANFAGAGFRPYAASNGGPNSMGNCNNWLLQDARISGCEHGVYVQGYDANAGNAINVDCSSNRRWGFWDASFLGNSFFGCHAASNGRDATLNTTAYARYDNQTYHAVPSASLADYVNTVPGTNEAVWHPCSSTSYQRAWEPGLPEGTFRSGGGYHSTGNNARAAFISCYNEGGQGVIWLSSHSIMMGGFVVETPVASGAHFEGRFGAVWTRNGFTSQSGAAGHSVTANLGGGGTGRVVGWSTPNSADWQLKVLADGSWGLSRQNAGLSRLAVRSPSENAYPEQLQLSGGFVRGSGNTSKLFGAIGYSTASGIVMPSSGTYYRGDILIAPAPNAGDYIGIVCTTSGEAGSTAVFKKFGTVEA